MCMSVLSFGDVYIGGQLFPITDVTFTMSKTPHRCGGVTHEGLSVQNTTVSGTIQSYEINLDVVQKTIDLFVRNQLAQQLMEAESLLQLCSREEVFLAQHPALWPNHAHRILLGFRPHVQFLVELMVEVPGLYAVVFIPGGNQHHIDACRRLLQAALDLHPLSKYVNVNGRLISTPGNIAPGYVDFVIDADWVRGRNPDVIVVKELTWEDR